MKVLIVDDNPENTYMLESLLKGNGYRVTIAANGTEAMEHLKQEPAELIISDILMPKMDGVTFNSRLLELGMGNIPVIVLTNMTSVLTQDTVKDVLIKSDVSLEDIVNKVKSYLGLR